MTFQRARSEEQREIRREAILDTAAAMLDEMPVADVGLNELSRRVGLAKSNVLRYFESREEVLLELLDRSLRAWLAEVSDLGADLRLSVRERVDRLAAVLSGSLARHTVLCDLVGAQAGVLERNVSVEVVLRFKRSTLGSLGVMVDLVRRHVPELGDGARTVCMMTVIMAGALSSYCQPSASAVAAVEADPTLVEFHLDLAASLESAIVTLIEGTLARG